MTGEVEDKEEGINRMSRDRKGADKQSKEEQKYGAVMQQLIYCYRCLTIESALALAPVHVNDTLHFQYG